MKKRYFVVVLTLSVIFLTGYGLAAAADKAGDTTAPAATVLEKNSVKNETKAEAKEDIYDFRNYQVRVLKGKDVIVFRVFTKDGKKRVAIDFLKMAKNEEQKRKMEAFVKMNEQEKKQFILQDIFAALKLDSPDGPRIPKNPFLKKTSPKADAKANPTTDAKTDK
jgi:hypothetical protein